MRGRTIRQRAGRGLAGLCAVLACATPCAAQESRAIRGTVVDASTGRPLEGVTIVLGPAPSGLVRGAAGLVPDRSAVTGPDGRYLFDDVPPGVWTLRIARIGFRAVTLETTVRRPTDARISVGLELEPLALEPVRVDQRALDPFRRVSHTGNTPDGARSVLERRRQELYLTPDSRIVTQADVDDGVTLGGSDVFRALQRFAGIATRDDYTAELWTRGAPWAQTRVTFDDVPLFNPVHAVGVFSGVVTDALGTVILHSGVRSAAQGEGAAGAVELRSRAASGTGNLRGAADASMASAQLTLEQNAGERVAWLVSARRSYLDLFTDGYDWLGLGDLDLPYAFHDLVVRVDAPVGGGALTASALWEQDNLFGDVDGVLDRTNAEWGNIAARTTFEVPVGRLALRQNIGVSRYGAFIREAGDSTVDVRGDPWIEPETDNALLHVRAAGDLTPRSDGAPSWSVGYEAVWQSAAYDGPEPRLHPVRPDTSMRVVRDDEVFRSALWGEGRWTTGALTVQPGIRVEAGTRTLDAGPVRVAPRLHVRLAAGASTLFSVAAGRTWQDLQSLALAGPSAHPAFHAGQFWLQAGENVPALRADLLTAGVEHWQGGWLLGASAYRRWSTGMTLPDPRTGTLARRPLFVTGSGEAHGVEASIRKVAGVWTGGAAWTWGDATVEAYGHRYPSSADRRHRVDASSAVRLPAGFRAAVAWTAMTGAPFTRVTARAPENCDPFGFECGQTITSVEAPNANRTPPYRSLDAMLVWSRPVGRAGLSAYLQIRNVLDRDNASTYSGTVPHLVQTRSGTTVEWIDRFEAGLPRVPLLGARVSF